MSDALGGEGISLPIAKHLVQACAMWDGDERKTALKVTPVACARYLSSGQKSVYKSRLRSGR
ncbi:hypothetical protein GB937_006245 [Aspergillus fischeri]|nr:hypothetical protein GB937_006245 [Aspergillus fischeri]